MQRAEVRTGGRWLLTDREGLEMTRLEVRKQGLGRSSEGEADDRWLYV